MSRVPLILLLITIILSGCKKDSAGNPVTTTDCNITSNPLTRPLNDKIHGLDVWPSGNLVTGHDDSILIFNSLLAPGNSFSRGDFDEVVALNDQSFWTFKSEIAFDTYVSTPAVSAWVPVGFNNNCDEVFQYFDASNPAPSFSASALKTHLRSYNQNGELRFERFLSGVNQGNTAASTLELDGEIWLATLWHDSIDYKLLQDSSGVFKDTLTRNWRGAAIHLHRLNYSGKLLATYKFDSVLNRYGESMEQVKLFLLANNQKTWVITNDEILELDRQLGESSILPLPFNSCTFRITDAAASSKGLYFSVSSQSGTDLLYFRNMNNESSLINLREDRSYFAGSSGEEVFLVREDAIFALNPQSELIWSTAGSGIYLDPHRTVRGCDGSFFGTGIIEGNTGTREVLFKIASDGQYQLL